MVEKIELSISPSYVNWSWWQAIREIFQNGMDSHDKGCALTYYYYSAAKRLVVRNSGASLPRETLVLGVSSKKGVSSQRGEFGEGYKLACATFCRLGAKVQIQNGAEVWVPELAHSEKFNTEVLTFNVAKVAEASPLTFVIEGVPESEWLQARDKLLFLHDKYPTCISVSDGRILTDDRFKNKLYASGIFVAELPDQYSFGYDLLRLNLDRDRNAPDTYSLRSSLSKILKRVVESGLLSPEAMLKMLAAGGGEAMAFSVDYEKPSDFHKKISCAFEAAYGNNAVPVSSLEESMRAGDFGFKGIVVNPHLLGILRRVRSTLDKVIESKIFNVTKTYSVPDFSEQELLNLKWAISLVAKVEVFDLKSISVVDFEGNKLYGKYEPSEGHAYLAKRVLSDRAVLIATLIHELCHKYGPDGAPAHKAAIEDRMSKLIVLLAGVPDAK